jgi:hypothetical protein
MSVSPAEAHRKEWKSSGDIVVVAWEVLLRTVQALVPKSATKIVMRIKASVFLGGDEVLNSQ